MLEAFDVRTNFPDLLRAIDKTRIDQLPQAMSWALNATADKVKVALVEEMGRVFDRPTPYTLNAMYVRWSTKRRLVASVSLKDNGAGDTAAPGTVNKGTAAAAYLKPEIEGGARNLKRMERALQAAGLLPVGMFAVPAKEAPLDAYGNVPSQFIIRMLSDLRAFTTAGYRANRKAGRRKGNRATNAFFVPPAGSHLKPGIYWRMPGRMLVPVFIFTRAPTYRARFDFKGISEKVAREEYPRQFPDAWRRALATDRTYFRLAA